MAHRVQPVESDLESTGGACAPPPSRSILGRNQTGDQQPNKPFRAADLHEQATL